MKTFKTFKWGQGLIVSPKKAARALGVSEASIKRWCDRGLIPAFKTNGGHRRIQTAALMNFVRDQQHPLPFPEMLGLPVGLDLTRQMGMESETLAGLLVDGDVEGFRANVVGAYLSGTSMVRLLDEFIAPCFHRIGERWADGSVAVHQERLAVELCRSVLHELRGLQGTVEHEWKRALGGTLSGDWYALPGLMVNLVLGEQGWHSVNLGNNLPADTLMVRARDGHFDAVNELGQACKESRTVLVMGGKALDVELRKCLKYAVFCDNLTQFSNFLGTVFGGEHAPGN